MRQFPKFELFDLYGMTLTPIERTFDPETALSVAHYAEYTWHQDSTHDPFVAPREAKG